MEREDDRRVDTGRNVNIRTEERRAHERQGERRGVTGTGDAALKTNHPSPLKLVLVTIFSIFIAESVVMSILPFLPPHSNTLEIFIDSFLLIILVLLPIHFFFMKPMKASLAERKLLEEKLRTLTLTDELTGLYNRRGLFIFAEQALKSAHRSGQALCLLYIDLDRFKKINDEHGHKEGDRVLVETADILKKNLRDSDIIARLGGDEFVIVPLGTSMNCLDVVIDRLEKGVQEHNNASSCCRLSISIGSASSEAGESSSIDDLLAKADALMYDQKISKSDLQ